MGSELDQDPSSDPISSANKQTNGQTIIHEYNTSFMEIINAKQISFPFMSICVLSINTETIEKEKYDDETIVIFEHMQSYKIFLVELEGCFICVWSDKTSHKRRKNFCFGIEYQFYFWMSYFWGKRFTSTVAPVSEMLTGL